MHRFTLIVLMALAVESAADEFRTWTTSSGRRSDVRLKLIDQTDVVVRLQREDNGKIISLPKTGLSREDRQYVKTLSETPTSATAAAGDAAASGRNTDWSQWRGANRDGISSETGLLDAWPSSGPPLLWNITGLGEGYSTPSVSDGEVFVLGTRGSEELLFCLSLSDGSIKWTCGMGQKAGGGGYPGPRGTPTVDGQWIYAIGSDGTLACIDRKSGDMKWRKNFKQDFSGQHGHWDYAESPLIDDDKLICTPGGPKGTMVALNKNSGAVIWSGSAAELGGGYTTASYASPIVAQFGGARQYIAFLHGGVVGFDSKTGQGLCHYDAPANWTANCSTPVVADGAVFAASGYGTGGGKATVRGSGTRWNVNEDYFVKEFQNHHGGFVLVDGFLYGTNDSVLLCVDWKTGNVRWKKRSVGKGSTSFADGHLYVRSEQGDVALVKASPEDYVEVGKFSQPDRSDKNAWPHPVISNGKLLLRDQDRMLCYDIKAPR
ncbi:MAG: PQQ-binding-like beta-propeller repeat protein [Pirellulaceae bacterium]